MKILVFDPGGTTGYSSWIINDHGAFLFEYGHLKNWTDFERLFFVKPQLVIIERVRKFRPGMRNEGIEAGAVLQYICVTRHIPFVFQEAQILNAVRKWGTIPTGFTRIPHEWDAIAHGIGYIKLHFPERTITFGYSFPRDRDQSMVGLPEEARLCLQAEASTQK